MDNSMNNRWNFFPKFLLKEQEIRLKFIEEEYLHIKSIVEFFSLGKDSEALKGTSLRSTVGYLQLAVEHIGKQHNEAKQIWERMHRLLQGISASQSYELLPTFLSDYVKVTRILENLAEVMDFLQRKIVSLLESYPGYYPSPKETSIREATKIHLFMELIAKNFLQILQEGSDARIHFYWDFNKHIQFIDRKNLLIINTDYNLPHRQAHWIILGHEVLHYLTNKENIHIPKIVRKIRDYAKQLGNTIFLALASQNLKVPETLLKETELYDIFIDALMAKALGTPYVLASFPYLFLAEDRSFEEPKTGRVWYHRLKTILDVVESSREKKFSLLLECLEFSLAVSYYAQKKYCLNIFREKTYEVERIRQEVIETFVRKFLVDEEVKK